MKPLSVPTVAAPAAAPRRVILVDDHGPTLAAIVNLLDSEFPRIAVVGVATDSESARRILRDSAPDVVVLDLDLGNDYGMDLIPMIVGEQGAAVVILTASDDPGEKSAALRAGAAAFISKLAPAEDLIAAILAAPNGRRRIGGLS